MKNFTCSFFLICALGFTALTLPQIGRAQPADPAPKAPVVDARKAADKAMQEMIDKFKKMTPEELRAYTLEMQEEMLRSQLSHQGFNDLELQEIVINFLRERNVQRKNVRAAASHLRDAVKDAKTPGENFAPLLAQLQAVADEEQVQRQKASDELAHKLKLAEHPRLEAMLHLNGFIGDEIWYLGDSTVGISAVNGLAFADSIPEINEQELNKGAAMVREMGENINLARMTPAQIRVYLYDLEEKRLRGVLSEAGFGDEKTQKVIFDWLRAQEVARTEIRFVAGTLRDAIANPNSTDFTILTLIGRWQGLADEEETRRENSILQLHQTLELDNQPRLNALLHLYGIVGDETWRFGDALVSQFALAILPTKDEIRALDVK